MTHHIFRPNPGPLPVNDLADRDARLLLDIGLVRAADGSLRLADDPAVAAVAAVRGGGRLARVVGWVRAVLGSRRFTPATSRCSGVLRG